MYIDKCQVVDNKDGTCTITGPCYVTKKPYSLTVKTSQLQKYLNGEYVQKAFPSLRPEQREFLISGTSPEGWNQVFGDEVDEDGEYEEDEYQYPDLNIPDDDL